MAEAAETEEKKLEPKVDLKEVGPCKLQLHIDVSAEKVKERIEAKYKDLNDSVALPGFRKGHAPRNLLDRKFGKAILEDLKFELISTAFDEVKEEKKLEPLGQPEFDAEKLAVQEGSPFVFDIVIETRPTFEVKSYTGLTVKKPAIDVSDAEIDQTLKDFQEAKAELVPAEGKAKEGDQVILDLELASEGKVIDKAENTALFLNEGISFYGLALKDFHKSIEGRGVGESAEFSVTLPDSFPDKAYSGKPAVIKAAIKSVKRKHLPELNDEFAKGFDTDNMAELREYLKKRILREKEEEVQVHMSDQIVQALVEQNDFPMPEGLIATGTQEALGRMRLDLASHGVKEEEIEKKIEGLKGESREGMVKSLKAHFILEHIAQKEKIFVTEDQVEQRVAQLASRQGVWPHEMKGYLEQHGLMTQLRRQMREDLVREFLVSKAVVEEAKKS